MEHHAALVCRLFANAFCYPLPESLSMLQKSTIGMKDGNEKKALLHFIDAIHPLSLGEWEELHTRTLDLNPPAAPYIGYQVWGESYQRGVFLSQMSHELRAAEVDTEDELPDHLIPVLRYLAESQNPIPELLQVLVPAVERMSAALRQADAKNPYLYLFDGVLALSKSIVKEVA